MYDVRPTPVRPTSALTRRDGMGVEEETIADNKDRDVVQDPAQPAKASEFGRTQIAYIPQLNLAHTFKCSKCSKVKQHNVQVPKVYQPYSALHRDDGKGVVLRVAASSKHIEHSRAAGHAVARPCSRPARRQ